MKPEGRRIERGEVLKPGDSVEWEPGVWKLLNERSPFIGLVVGRIEAIRPEGTNVKLKLEERHAGFDFPAEVPLSKLEPHRKAIESHNGGKLETLKLTPEMLYCSIKGIGYFILNINEGCLPKLSMESLSEWFQTLMSRS